MRTEIINLAIDDIPEIKEDTRLFNCLKRAGINTITDIILLNTDKLDNIKNLGNQTRKHLQDILNKYDIVRIDERNFEKEIMPYIEETFPNYIFDILDINIKDSDMDSDLKEKLSKVGFTTILGLTTPNAKKVLCPPEYDKVKNYLKEKNLITFEDKFYPFFIKKYDNKNKTTESLELNKYEMREKNSKLKEENEYTKALLETYQPELKEYEKLKEENNKLLRKLRELKKALEESRVLKKEIEKNKQKLNELQKEKEKLDNQLIEYLNNQGINHGTR